MINKLYKFLDFLAVTWSLKRNVTILSKQEIEELELSRLKLKTIRSQILEDSSNASVILNNVRKTLGIRERTINEKVFPH